MQPLASVSFAMARPLPLRLINAAIGSLPALEEAAPMAVQMVVVLSFIFTMVFLRFAIVELQIAKADRVRVQPEKKSSEFRFERYLLRNSCDQVAWVYNAVFSQKPSSVSS